MEANEGLEGRGLEDDVDDVNEDADENMDGQLGEEEVCSLDSY